MTSRVANRLYEAGCADATIAFQNGELSIDYDRTAASLDRMLILLARAGNVRRITRADAANSDGS